MSHYNYDETLTVLIYINCDATLIATWFCDKTLFDKTLWCDISVR